MLTQIEGLFGSPLEKKTILGYCLHLLVILMKRTKEKRQQSVAVAKDKKSRDAV